MVGLFYPLLLDQHTNFAPKTLTNLNVDKIVVLQGIKKLEKVMDI
uniref:Uncharacterized protein n=1 Tax=Arundo donax TaxID=35708 RepID=A0A0A9CRJ8_ARUDO